MGRAHRERKGLLTSVRMKWLRREGYGADFPLEKSSKLMRLFGKVAALDAMQTDCSGIAQFGQSGVLIRRKPLVQIQLPEYEDYNNEPEER